MILFTDLDGTLIHNENISNETIQAFEKLNKEKHYTILASGRPLSGMLPIHERIFKEINQYNRYILCFNGAGVYDALEKKYVYDAGLNKMQIMAIIDEAKKIDLDLVLYTEDNMYSNNINNEYAILEGKQNFTNIKFLNYEDLKNISSKKILGVINPEKTEEKIKTLTNIFEKNLTITSSAPFFIEITKPKIDKGNAIEFLFTYLKFNKKEAYAFGDGNNDISMFKSVSTSIAVDNATDALKKIATHHTDSVELNGFANFVNNHILNK